MKSTLTKKQLAALDCSRNIAVTAGAGTGKTFILVERYLDILINHDVDIRQVLAITFTKKAAAEMMTRVAERINELLTENPSPQIHERLLHIKGYLSASFISTIHGFCSRILREYPVEAGIDPDFTQLSDMQSEILFSETFDEVINELDEEESEWIDLFRSLNVWSVEQMLREALGHRFEMRRVVDKYNTHAPEIIFGELVETYLREAKKNTDPGSLKQIVLQVQDILTNLDVEKKHPFLKHLVDFHHAPDQSEIGFWRALVNLRIRFTTGDKRAYSNLRFLGGKDIWGKENVQRVLDLSELLAHLSELPEPAPDPSDLYLLRIMVKFCELYRRIEQGFQQKKQMHNTVDYEDLQLLVYDLLKSDESLCQNIAERFRYIMADEFQDTNPLQWEIVGLLGNLNDNKYFIVGDPKQSIYGFRNADVRVFQQVKQSFIDNSPEDQYLTDIIMEDSFRFKTHLAEFINHLFTAIMSNNSGIEWEVGYDSMSCKRADADGGEVEIGLVENDSQPEFIAANIQNMIRQLGWEFGDIAILLRTRNHLVELEETLRQEGIPFKTIGGIGFFQRQEIYDVYHLVRFLISPSDDIAVIGLLRSPFADISDEGIFMLACEKEPSGYWQKVLKADQSKGMLSDEYQKIKRFRALAKKWLYWRDRMSFNELLDRIFNQSGFRAVYAADQKSARYLANLDKILEQAVELERGGFASLADFGEALQNLIRSQVQESEAQVEIEDKKTVKIMTIHQAKGLEFPVVILPYLEQQLRSESFNNVIFDEEFGFAPTLSGGNDPGFLPRIVRTRAHQKILAELKRLFYVGCTRAKDRLILTGTIHAGNVPTNTPLSWLISHLDIDPAHLTNTELHHGISIRCSMPGTEEIRVTPPGQIMSNIVRIRDYVSGQTRSEAKPDYFLGLEARPEGEVFSATQLMIFGHNPAEYFERYHLGYFASDYDFSLRLETEEDTALLRGKLIHKYFEEFPEFDLERTLYEYEITDPKIITRMHDEVAETIERIGKSVQISDIMAAKEYINEVSVMRKLGDDLITGTLDRLFRNRDGKWEIIDYKTNRISVGHVDQVTTMYKRQLEVYALLLAGLYPDQGIYPVNLYFTHIDLLRQHRYKAEDLRKFEDSIRETIKGIKKFSPYRQGKDLHLIDIEDKF